MGDAIVADVGADARGARSTQVGRVRPRAAARAPGARAGAGADPMSPSTAVRRARRGVPRGRDRRARVARRPRSRCATSCASRGPAATTSAPAAASASACRRRSACSSPSPSGRSCACSARARRSTRSRRSGRPPPTTCRSRSSCCATTSTRSSSGSRRSRTSTGAPGPRPAGARRRRRGERLRRATRARSGDATSCATRWPRRSPRTARARRGPRRARHGAGVARRRGPARAGPTAIAPDRHRAGGGPRARRARRRDARAAARRPRARCSAPSSVLAPRDRPDPLRLRRQPLPALPAGRRRWRTTPGTSRRVLDYARGSGTPVTFRVGRHEPQRAVADRRHPGRRAPPLARRRGRGRRGARARAPGHRARPRQPRCSRRCTGGSGPDPASTDIATVGGVIANNSGGMRCGVT